MSEKSAARRGNPPQNALLQPDDKVKLKPVLGIRPGIYLSVLYLIALLVILFFLLIFPGLHKPGSLIVLKTEPAGAALRVDGVYMGTCGDKIFVPKGTHTLEAVIPGFENESAVIEIPGRVFGSLLFPRRFEAAFTLKTADPAAVFSQAAADYAGWSFAGEPTAVWQIPLSLSEGAYRAGPENDPMTRDILRSASRFTVTRAALRDLIRAKMIIDNSGLSPSPATLAGSVSDILSFLSENKSGALWLADLLPPESGAIVKKSGWYESSNNVTYAQKTQDIPNARRITVERLNFIYIESGHAGFAEPYPYSADIKSFYICENPVPDAVYQEFLKENPSWNDEQRNIFPPDLPGTKGASPSWFAAQAFCQWLTKRLPSSMANMEVRLPDEDEWEYAAISGVPDMRITNWEWCADPFVPLPFIKTGSKAKMAVSSPEFTLRGRLLNNPETRASLPPGETSPFVTFRPVITEK